MEREARRKEGRPFSGLRDVRFQLCLFKRLPSWPVLRATVHLTPLHLFVLWSPWSGLLVLASSGVSGFSIGSIPCTLCPSEVCLGREHWNLQCIEQDIEIFLLDA